MINKIAVFSPFLNPVGVKEATFGLSKKFSENNFNVDLLSVHNEWEDMEFTENMNLLYLSRGFKKFPTRGYLKFRFTSLFISLRTVFTLSKYLKTTKPEFLFVSMMPFIAWVALKISRNDYTKFIVSIQGYPRNNYFRRFIWRKVFKSANKVVAESESLMEMLKKMTGLESNITHIYNPHFENQNDFNVFDCVDIESSNYILGLGRLTKQKNFKLLINAFSKLKNDELNLIIVGDGEEKSMLKKIVKDLNLSSKVIFKGEINKPLNYIKKAKMIVIPSLWEGLPRVAVEAQALKTPIISSCKDGGLGEILLNGEAGQIVKKDDIDDLVKAIKNYLNDDELKIKHVDTGFKNIDRFSLDSSSKKYLKLLSETKNV